MSYPTKKLWEILEIIRNWKSCKQTSDKNWNKITRIETISFWVINEVKVWYFHLTNEEKIKYQIDKWDILFSHINSVEHIWKIAIAKKNYSDLFHWMNLLLLRWNKKDISDEYLYITLQFYFKSWYWAKICNKAINQASLNQKNIIDIIIPLPPLPTQKLIVQKLDSSFEKIDKSIELTKKNLENIEELNKSVLEKVFREWKYNKKMLWEISDIINWWTPDTQKEIYWDWDIFWITPKDMWKLNWVYVNNTIRKISSEWLKNSSAKVFPINSIILSSRAPIWYLAINTVPMATNQWCKAIVPSDILDAKFLYYFLSISVKLLNDLWSWTTFKELSSWKLKEVELPLPPLQKQKEIVAQLDKVFEKNKALKQSYEKKLKDLEDMKQSLLKEAFEGRLVRE